MKSNADPEIEKRKRLIKIFISHAVKVQLASKTETEMQIAQPFASHEFVLAVSRRGFVSGGIVLSSMDYNAQKNIIHNIPAPEKTIQRFFADEKFGTNKAMQNILL